MPTEMDQQGTSLLRPHSRASSTDNTLDDAPEQSNPLREHETQDHGHESDEPNEGPSPETQPIFSTKLHRSSYIFILTAIYSSLALFSWIVICILDHRPITAAQYGYYGPGFQGSPSDYAANEKWYKTARVIQSIVVVSTIPLTSAVCSNAAVIFLQHNGIAVNLTLRQLLVLADRGWTNPITYFKSLKSSHFMTKMVYLLQATHV